MPSLVIKPAVAWANRFRRPGADELVSAVGSNGAAIIRAGRERLSGFPGVSEDLRWCGIPWRWAFAYTHKEQTEPALAYLVPQPSKPVLVVPVPPEMLGTLPMKRLSKPVRDGIVFASIVGQTRWAQWELSAVSQLDELMDVIGLRLPQQTEVA